MAQQQPQYTYDYYGSQLPDAFTWSCAGNVDSYLGGSPVSTTSEISSTPILTPPYPTSSLPLETPKPSRKKRSDRVSRPPNAFFIFRSEFWAREKLKPQPVERDNRYISRIAGHVWNQLDPAVKRRYHALAFEYRQIHKLRHPDYQYKPGTRKTSVRRKTANALQAEEHCRRLATSIMPDIISSTSTAQTATFIPSEPQSEYAPGLVPQDALQSEQYFVPHHEEPITQLPAVYASPLPSSWDQGAWSLEPALCYPSYPTSDLSFVPEPQQFIPVEPLTWSEPLEPYMPQPQQPSTIPTFMIQENVDYQSFQPTILPNTNQYSWN